MTNDPVVSEGAPLPGSGWAAACHLAPFSGLIIPFGNLLGPLAVWLFKRGAYPFVDEQGRESLNFQISILLYSFGILLLVGGPVAALFLLGVLRAEELRSAGGALQPAMMLVGGALVLLLVLLVALSVFALVCQVCGAVRASQSKPFRYPATVRFIS